MYKVLYIVCAMMLSYPALSQNTIKGTIIDAETGEPVFGASVSIPKQEKGSLSSQEGTYQITHLTNGNYHLVISSLGYATRTFNVTVPTQNSVDITLEPSAIEMEEVIVSTPFHRLQSENVVMVTRATVDDLNRSGAVTLVNGISQLPGVETVTTGAGIGKPVIRGLSSNRVLVYAQGVRLENQQYGDEHGLGLSSSGVESVEVIKGPASLLYGSDALGGVLYLNPEKYSAQNSTEVDAAAAYHSNTLGTEVNAGVKSSGERFKYLLRGNYATHSDYQTGNDLRVTNSRFDEIDFKTGIGYQDAKYRGDFRYNYNNSGVGIPEEVGIQSTSKELLEPYQEIHNHILSFDNRLFFRNSSLDVKVGYLFNNRKEFEDHHHHEEEEHEEEEHQEEEELEEGEHPALEMHLETLNYDIKYNTPQWGNFETIIGLQGMFQTNTNFGEEILVPDAQLRDVGILATTHYHLDKFDFQAGVRFDNRKLESKEHGEMGDEGYFAPIIRDFTSYNGALGVKFQVLPALTARINSASGFRAPNLAELTANGSHEGTNRYEIGNEELENEQNYQLDLAIEYRNEHFEFFANAFYNRIDNYIYLNPTGDFIDEDPVFEYLQNHAKLYGGEAGLHIHPHPIHWLHIESSVEIVEGQKGNGENLPLIPATSFTNTFRVELEKAKILEESYGFVTLKTTLEQDDTGIFETATPGYSLLSAGFGGNFNLLGIDMRLRIAGSNLLDKTYTAHLSRLKPDGISNMGRNVTINLRAAL